MNTTIKSRLFAGCSLLIGVLAVACLLGWRQAATSETRIGRIIHENQADFSRLQVVEGAELESARARAAERDFLLGKDPAKAQAVASHVAGIRQSLDRLAASSSPEQRTALNQALTSTENYGAAFQKMNALLIQRGLNPDAGLEGQLRRSAHAIEGTVTNQGLRELEIFVLKCRRHEKDYLLRGKVEYLDDIAKRIEEFKQALAPLPLPEDTKAATLVAWKNYFASMQQIVETDQQIAGARKECEQAADLFQKQLTVVSQATAATIAAAQTNALQLMASGKFFMLILLGVGLVLGAGVALGLTRAITKPINSAIESLSLAAGHTKMASSQVSAASQSLAEGSSEQAASIEESSASLEEMASMTRRNAENAQKANELARQTRTAADQGATSMTQMSAAMEAIKVSSDDIAKIIKTIDEIAFQTNILALNAAVEAARAGESGMGFAVVADEVRNLAQRSAQAAKETAEKIEGAISKTAQGVTLSAAVADALHDIVSKARQVDELAAEVATASREQTQGITQINQAVGQMDRVTQHNAANAEESAAAAEELSAQAHVMAEAVASLRQLSGLKASDVERQIEPVSRPASFPSKMTFRSPQPPPQPASGSPKPSLSPAKPRVQDVPADAFTSF